MMDWLERIVLVAIYPLMIASRLASALTGRDPLRLREPQGTCWSERPPMPPPSAYFHDGPHAERLPMAQRLLVACSRMLHGRTTTATRSGEADIPDEIYTLW